VEELWRKGCKRIAVKRAVNEKSEHGCGTVEGQRRAREVSQSIPRARSQPIEDRSEEDSESQIRGLQKEARADGAEDGSDVEAASLHQKVSESENYRIALEDEETVRWGDAEDEAEEPLGWDFSDLRRRSSVLSGALRVVNQDSRGASHYGGLD
jgi:hypothetical protein